jgi:hypothetical protein
MRVRIRRAHLARVLREEIWPLDRARPSRPASLTKVEREEI